MNRKTTSGAALVAALMGLVWSIALLSPAPLAAQSRYGANYFPNVKMTTQDGDEVRFYDLIKGKIVAIDLIYTNCQYACPLETARMARMQQLLGDRMGKDVFFISISIDPQHDTPEVLKAYAEKYQAGPGWIFLRGTLADTDVLSKKLGLWSDPTQSADGHTPMLLVGNEATGQWLQTSALDNPAYTARIINTWMDSWKNAKPVKSYAEAAPIKKGNDGQYLYASLCANCHTIGNGDKIGPDLSIALDTRERAWLTRYTFEPDVLREKNDPIATMLRNKFGQVRMPNMGLNIDEVKAILRYVEMQKSHGSHTETKVAAPRVAATSQPSALVDAAIAIQVALARDTMVGVVAQATAVRQAAAALGAPGRAIETAATDLGKQTTIADARRAFGDMNDALIRYVKDARTPLSAGVRVAYCPMLRKSWLQMEGPLANPYYGAKMLGCGEFTN